MTPSNSPKDNNFSSFAVGVSIGVIAALLFGTEQGRKIVKETLDAIPDKYKKIPESILPPQELESKTTPTPIITSYETSHHTTYEFESPPPPPPVVHLSRPQ